MARHRSPGSRHATPAPPQREARTEQGGSARTAHRTPAHHNAAVLVAVAAVIAVTGSILSLAGALGEPDEPSNAEVNLASDDLALLSPDPVVPPPEDSEEPDTEPADGEDGEDGEEEDGEGESGKDSDEDAEEDASESAETRSSRHLSSPAELIDPQNWYLTLPTGSEGDPDTVPASELDTYDSKYFRLNDSKDGVVFTANAGGVTTENSKYPRSELREMKNGEEKASWDAQSGTHTMELDQAITKTPSAKPDVIAGQIHGGDDDVMQIHLSGNELTVKYADGDKEAVLDDSYQLGERFHVKIQSSDGEVKVWHNGELKADLPISGGGNYFKAGAYVNSNPDKGASSSDVGQVVIYDLEISHS